MKGAPILSIQVSVRATYDIRAFAFARFTLTFAICAYLSDFPFPPSAFRLLFTNQCFGVIFHQLVMAEKKTTLLRS
jgi:hypothetical protein